MQGFILPELKKEYVVQGLHVLDDSSVIIDGVLFVGGTLWTDFELYSHTAIGLDNTWYYKQDAKRGLNDFSGAILNEAGGVFSPNDSIQMHKWTKFVIEDELKEGLPTVVITHHLPLAQSIDPRSMNSDLNPCYASNLDSTFERENLKLWVHGHTHSSNDYVRNSSRIVSNPKGYPNRFTHEMENKQWNPKLTIELGQEP